MLNTILTTLMELLGQKIVFSSKEASGLEKHSFDNSVENFPQRFQKFILIFGRRAESFQTFGKKVSAALWKLQSMFACVAEFFEAN